MNNAEFRALYSPAPLLQPIRDRQANGAALAQIIINMSAQQAQQTLEIFEGLVREQKRGYTELAQPPASRPIGALRWFSDRNFRREERLLVAIQLQLRCGSRDDARELLSMLQDRAKNIAQRAAPPELPNLREVLALSGQGRPLLQLNMAIETIPRAAARSLLAQVTHVANVCGISLSDAVHAMLVHSGFNIEYGAHNSFGGRLCVHAGYPSFVADRSILLDAVALLRNSASEHARDVLQVEEVNPTQRDILQEAASRDSAQEALYDSMFPAQAWQELCHYAGRPDLGDAVFFTPHFKSRAGSQLVYELDQLPADEHIAGLRRASGLAMYTPPVPGLSYRLGLGENASVDRVLAGIARLSKPEAQQLLTELRSATAGDRTLKDVFAAEGTHVRLSENSLEHDTKRLFEALSTRAGYSANLAVSQPSLQQHVVRSMSRSQAFDNLAKVLERAGVAGKAHEPDARVQLLRACEGRVEGYVELLLHRAGLSTKYRMRPIEAARDHKTPERKPAAKSRGPQLAR